MNQINQKSIHYILATSLMSFVFFPFWASSQSLVFWPEGLPPGPEIFQPNPWEDPTVVSINREVSHATAYSFRSVTEAIDGDREKSDRYINLNGEWDFKFAINPDEAHIDFYKEKVLIGTKLKFPPTGK